MSRALQNDRMAYIWRLRKTLLILSMIYRLCSLLKDAYKYTYYGAQTQNLSAGSKPAPLLVEVDSYNHMPMEDTLGNKSLVAVVQIYFSKSSSKMYYRDQSNFPWDILRTYHEHRGTVFLRVAGVVPSASEGLVSCDLWFNGPSVAVQSQLGGERNEPQNIQIEEFTESNDHLKPTPNRFSSQNISRKAQA